MPNFDPVFGKQVGLIVLFVYHAMWNVPCAFRKPNFEIHNQH